MRLWWLCLNLCLGVVVLSITHAITAAHAHEVRPGYIEINETTRDHFEVLWKQPVRDGLTQVAGLGLRPVFPPHCARAGDSTMRRQPGVLVESFALTCAGGLLGHIIGVEGLQKTITDIFVRLTLNDGDEATLRLTAEQPARPFVGGGAGLWSYFRLGVEHLLFGFDHILFVLGLVLLVAGWRRLVWVITSFTLAHSLTLALSALGIIAVSPPLVEAIIALSLIFVAVELARPPERRSLLATRYPQLVAFTFGLLHGFGFAGVLAQIGLPRDAALWALALFNLGLEVGQLAIVGVIIIASRVMRTSIYQNTAQPPAIAGTITDAACLLIGSLGVYWLLARTLIIF